jgi:preprotein translocase subunit SecA
MEQVKALGGLHVIGSGTKPGEIDNQLRGRSARQGDPGPRIYLSMEDQLMRLFGGQQADAMMQRMKIDDSLPIESGLVGRLVEQARTSDGGANFDVRKHLLEYDDVLNAQRLSIYSQRDRIFTKPDITEDVIELLRVEVLRRVPEALSGQGGAWKLLAWLDQVQPPLVSSGKIFPSYSLKLILEQAINLAPAAEAKEIKSSLLEIARRSIEAERARTRFRTEPVQPGI